MLVDSDRAYVTLTMSFCSDFASTTHPDTCRDYIGQPSHRDIYSMSTDVAKIQNLSAPNPETKTPKNQQVEKKIGENVPPTNMYPN